MAARDASIIEEFIVESGDGERSVDLKLGVQAFLYYEDLFSPTLTAKAVVVNTGGSVPTGDGSFQSVYNGLPLRGGERVSIKIAGNSDQNVSGLDLSDKDNYMYVSKITDVDRQGLKERFTLHLVSKEAIVNETSRVYKKFPSASVDAHISSIVKENLLSEKPLVYDEVVNQYSFIGNLKKPFNLLVWLASKAVPKSGVAGYFFYETIDGYNFRSVEQLIADGKENAAATYYQQEWQDSEVSTDDRILEYGINVNNDFLSKLRFGTYASYFAEYDPYNSRFSLPQQGKRTLEDFVDKATTLGDDPQIPQLLNDSGVTLSNMPSRIYTSVLDVGVLDKGVNYNYSYNTHRDAIFRYNFLFTQVLEMTVPLNLQLRAGSVINCKFIKVTRNNKEFDTDQSGLYMIKELSHYFDGTESLTSMKLLRDTFGDN